MKFFILLPIFFLVSISFTAIAQNESLNDSTQLIGDTTKYVFEKVDVEATFPGGEAAWRKFLEQNLRADVPLKQNAPAGSYTVWVQFIVDARGMISDLRPLTNHGYGMENEILRVLRKSPKWVPASQNGILVKAYRKQPVTFVIEEVGRKRRH